MIDQGLRYQGNRRRLPPQARAAVTVVVGFSTIILVGTLLLASPLVTTDGSSTSLVDALFTSVSATSDTGLVVLDTADHWNLFGQLVIAALMFVGGIGIMASATIAVLLGRHTSLERRAEVSDTFGGSLGNARQIVRGTFVFALVAQAIGAIALAGVFLLFGDRPAPEGLAWTSIFQSISSFNNAGFDIVGGGRGYTVFVDRPDILAVTAVLIVFGGLGFVIATDVAGKRRWRPLALETKLVVVATVALIVFGAVAITAAEWTNPDTLGPLAAFDRIANGTFMSISPRSAGYTTVDLGALRPETDIVLILLMFVGSASGSTGGGMKVNTLAVLVLVAVSVAARREEPEAFGRRVTTDTVFRAIAAFFIFTLMNFAGLLLVAALSSVPIGTTLFETVSAMGTVGLSLEGSAVYGDPARLALAACMFVGRLGPLALIILLFGRQTGGAAVRRPAEPIRIG